MSKPDVSLGGTSYERVRDRLRADILNGVLPPGSRLKQAELSKQYGLSLMPVREAIQQLQGEGLVEFTPKRGAIVRVPDRRLVSQIFDIRIALEGALARRAAEVATPADLARLREAMDIHEREKADPDAHMRNHLNFHYVINSISGNVEAVNIVERHNSIIFGLRRRVGYDTARIDEIVADHRTIYAAIAAGDAEAAQKAAETHVRHSKEDMLKRMGD
jgi:DNA-binding GntR family transcriptional regulator